MLLMAHCERLMGDCGLQMLNCRRERLATFFLDRKQRLIRFSELFHGVDDRVVIYPKEVVPDTLTCGAEL